MKLEKTDSVDLGFAVPAAGTYIWQLMEFHLYAGKDDDPDYVGRSYRLQCQIDSVEDGDSEAVGMSSSIWIYMITKDGKVSERGGKQFSIILQSAGIFDKFVKKYGDCDEDDPKMIDTMQSQLPGTFFKATHIVGKDQNDNEQCNFTNISVLKKAGKKATPAPKPVQAASDPEPDDIDDGGWDD